MILDLNSKEKIKKAIQKILDKGYLLSLYKSASTGLYECEAVDPKQYPTESGFTLEDFANKYSATKKLYDNFNDFYNARAKLNMDILAKSRQELWDRADEYVTGILNTLSQDRNSVVNKVDEEVKDLIISCCVDFATEWIIKEKQASKAKGK